MLRAQSILLIEPEIDRDMYAYYLHTFGFTVQTADTTDDGLIRAGEADVIVTGIRMRGSLDGIELVRRLRNAARRNRTPIIVLTGCALQADMQRAYAAGCDVFLPKALSARSSCQRNPYGPETFVVRKEEEEGMVVYVLPNTPDADQYLLRTRDEAFAQVLAFAKRRLVRAWMTDEGDHSVLLEISQGWDRSDSTQCRQLTR